MKIETLGTAFVLLASMTGWAAEAPSVPKFEGRFVYQGRMSSDTALERRSVYRRTQEGLDELESLRKQGFDCESVDGSWTLCRKIHHDLTLPAPLAQKLDAQYQGKLYVEFQKETGPAVPLFQNPGLQEWQINQPVNLSGKSLGSFHYLDTSGVQKLIFVEDELVIYEPTPGKRAYALEESASTASTDGLGETTYYVELMLDPKN